MSFTDDDLKRLKEYISAYSPEMRAADTIEGNNFEFDEIEALIARLEAAEAALSSGCKFCHMDAWRKAAGRD